MNVGDKVLVSNPDSRLLKYEGWQDRAVPGKIIRIVGSKIRVEIFNTGSQDTEGHNAYEDFEKHQVTLVEEYKMTAHDLKLLKEFSIKMPAINRRHCLIPIDANEAHSSFCVAFGWFRAKGAGLEKAAALAREAVKSE